MILPKPALLALLLFFPFPTVWAAPVDCDRLTGVRDVLACALQNHPDSRMAQAAIEQGESLEDLAGQRPNPELNSQAVWGNTPAGEKYSYYELNLTHDFEVGGKRDARIARARAEQEQRRSSALGAREQVYISTLLALHHIRQIQSEVVVLRGALESYARIQRQFQARPRLNPEQTASLRIFEIAQGSTRLQLAPLQSELNREIHTIEHALGHSFDPRPELLPSQRTAWPKLADAELSGPVQGVMVRSSLSDLELARAQAGLARSDSWPSLKLGPTLQIQNQEASSFNAFGLNLSLTLPIFHLNGAGRTYFDSGTKKAEIALGAARTEGQHEREYHLKRYQGAVAALENALDEPQLERKHQEVEGLFTRGLLPGTTIIEIHRQMLDFIKNRNEQELAAIESLEKFYAIQGRLFEEQPL
jgi:cobalt-zinc-cadmium efflux system outer membrane protein